MAKYIRTKRDKSIVTKIQKCITLLVQDYVIHNCQKIESSLVV